MARSHRRPPIRDASGFRRLPDHGAALVPAELRALLDPQPGDAPDRVLATLTRVQHRALASLDGIAQRLPLIARARMLPACHPDLAFACGLDHAAPPARLGALLARAYARADRYAEACAEEIEVRADALSLANALSAALASLAGPGRVLWFKNRPGTRLADESAARRALRAYERMRWDADPVRAGRQEDLTAGLQVLEAVRASLDDLAAGPPALGWPSSDEARFFFLLRLAELFAVSTGVVPIFNGARPKMDPHAAWTDFAWAALDLTGLGRANFDALSRRLGGRRVGSEAAPRYAPTVVEARYGDDLTCLAASFAGAAPAHSLPYWHRLTVGTLPSVGRAADRHNNDPEPEDWQMPLFPSKSPVL